MTLDTWLRRIVIWGIFLVPFVPLIVAYPLFFPFITGKNFVFRIIVEVVFTAWAILALRDPTVRPKKSLLLILIGFFVFSVGISDFLGENSLKSFWSNFERMEGWIGLVHASLYFMILSSVFTERLWKPFLNTSIVVASVIGVYGLLQLSGVFTINQGGVRVDGTFGNATYLAVYMLFHVFITAYALVSFAKGKKLLQAFYGGALILETVMVFYAATRGTILGLIGGLLLTAVLILLFNRDNKLARTLGIASIVGVLLLTLGFIAIKNTQFVQNNEVLTRLAHISLQDGATRFTIWSMAYQGFAERPIFGWGQDGFNYVFNKYYNPRLYSQEQWFDRAHNAFLDWLLAGGLPAFFLYISLYAAGLWYVWRSGSMFSTFEKALFTGLVFAYAFHNIFVFDNLISYVFFMTIMAYFLSKSPGETVSTPFVLPKGTFVGAATVITIGMAAVIYFANVPGIASGYYLIEGIKQQPGGITENFNYLKKAVGGPLGRQEVREQLLQFALQVLNLKAGDAAFQNQVAQYAVTQMREEIQSHPNDARLRVFLGTFFNQVGHYDEARVELTAAEALSPKKQTIMFELGTVETGAGNLPAALEWFKKAYELDTNFESARIYYASAAIKMGNPGLASSLLLPHFQTLTPDNNTLLQAYLSVKDFKSVLTMLNARAVANPKDAKTHLQLGAVYLQAGDRTDAIQEIKNAIALDSSFKVQGEYYIQQIEAGKNP